MPTVSKSALVQYSAEEMYRLVVDVDAYPQFLPWCADAEVISTNGDEQVARIEIAKGPVRKSFTTKNALTSNEKITLRLVDGPFDRLEGQWRFDALHANASRVSLDMEFTLSSALLRRIVGPIFAEISAKMVDAFCARAQFVYGQR